MNDTLLRVLEWLGIITLGVPMLWSALIIGLAVLVKVLDMLDDWDIRRKIARKARKEVANAEAHD